jgi:hypothetical protein
MRIRCVCACVCLYVYVRVCVLASERVSVRAGKHSIGAVLVGFGAYFREKGLILEIGTYRKHYGLGRATYV